MGFKPIDAAKACLRRSRRFLALSEEDLSDPKIKNDLRRSAIIMVTAALDSYMHWLVIQRVSILRQEGDIPKALKKYKLPFSDLATLADAVIAQRKKGKDARPWVQIKNSLQRQILTDTFQSYEQVSSAFSMAGVERPWKKVAKELGVSTDDIRKKLNGIVHRRNQIAHEGDIQRSSRPRRLKYNAIEHDQVEKDINWVDSLIKAVEVVIV